MHTKFPVDTVSDLASLLGTSENHLWHLAENVEESYSFWKVPKKNPNEFRQLCSPHPKLKSIQQNLHTLVFKKLIYSKHSHFGLKKKSSITNAREHRGSKIILTRDLKSFFPSVRPERIRAALIKELGCSEQIASLITRLVTVNFELPQGASTSTDIANLVTLRLQRRLSKLAEQWGITKFTIYADDITFSADHFPEGFEDRVKKIIVNDGFKINAKKGGKFDKSKSQIITGVNIAHGPSVGKVKRNWRAEHHNNRIKHGRGEISKEQLNASEKRLNGRNKYAESVKRITAIPISR
jgi:RNA-directed DNA polymerase